MPTTLCRPLLPIIVSLTILLLAQQAPASEADRVRYIHADRLAKQLEQSHIIDTRSRLEYAMLHIKGATHIPVGTMMKDDLQRILSKNPLQPLVFYCNAYE